MTAKNRLQIAALTASALILMTGCSASTDDSARHAGSPAATSGPAEGRASAGPSAEPDEELVAHQANAKSIAGVFAADAAGWFDSWDGAGCTGDRAAENVEECQKLLMQLATTIEPAADMLSAQLEFYEPLADAAELGQQTADAAEEWLGAWCGAYADPACAAPGNALVEVYRDFAEAIAPWADDATPAP